MRNEALQEQFGIKELKLEVKSLKSKLDDKETKLGNCKYYFDELQKKYDELKQKMDLVMIKPSTSDAFTETGPMTGATYVEQMDWDRVNQRAEGYKSHYLNCVKAYNELNVEHKELRVQLNGLQSKYDQTKHICNRRFEVLGEKNRQIAELNQQLDELQTKSEFADKQLTENIAQCQATADLLDEFKVKYADAKSDAASYKESAKILEDQLTQLKDKYARLKEDWLKFKGKYATAKGMLNQRYRRLKYLEHKLNENHIGYTEYDERPDLPLENVPPNN